jgi:capsule polysaccharide export protein KpsC/LpsZ
MNKAQERAVISMPIVGISLGLCWPLTENERRIRKRKRSEKLNYLIFGWLLLYYTPIMASEGN